MRLIPLWILKLFYRKQAREAGSVSEEMKLLPDQKDDRDYDAFHLVGDTSIPSPLSKTKFSLKEYVNQVKNQGSIGSCGPHALTSAYELLLYKEHKKRLEGSELFLYYNARENKSTDCGITLREGIKAMQNNGFCLEQFWPYKEWKWIEVPPNIPAYYNANIFKQMSMYKIKNYYKCYNKSQIKQALLNGYPVVFGVKIYGEFYNHTWSTGEVKMPTPSEVYKGGHGMLIVGYDDEKRAFEVLNSWGDSFGNHGFCFIPYEYVDKFLIDAWVVVK